MISTTANKGFVETLRPSIPFIIFSFWLLAAAPQVFAQNVQLSAEQQRMLNQLPASQRQQALDALAQVNQQQQNGSEQSSIVEELSTPPQNAGLQVPELPLPVVALSAVGGSRLIINLTPKLDPRTFAPPDLTEDVALQRIQGSHYYELDEFGVLVLPGLPNIPLLGLTESSIAIRLGAEPALKVFDVLVTILEEKSIGASSLLPFGYEVFESTVSGFQPVTSGPVPPDYVLGPGDSIRVQLFGSVNGIYEFEVTRDGILNLPELGPVTVAGLPFSEFRADLSRRVNDMLIGTQVSVTMGRLRTVQLFVLGEVNHPGSFVVSSLATISSALYQSGGINRIGTLRDIQLKRQGRLVANLDLYDLLLNGDTSGDLRIQSGDVIFVPTIGTTVGVSGAVRRPAIYELKGQANVSEVIRLAGGLLARAFPEAARIERISDQRERVVLSVDADSAEARQIDVISGDTLIIPEVSSELNDTVVLAGHVLRPGPYQWLPGMRLVDLIPGARDLNPGADEDYVVIRRENSANRRVHVVSAKLSQAWISPDSAENIALQPRDSVFVFSLTFGRQRIIEPILEELQRQSRYGEPFSQVRVGGEVQAPGAYPLEPGMRVSDLMRAGGNLSEEAYTLDAELTRYSVIDDEVRLAEVIDVDLDAVMRGDKSADMVLTAHDHLSISKISAWESEWIVTIEGEVKFPGEYRIRRGETLREVLQRAGGLTEEAFPEGSIFLRESLRDQEQEQIDLLVRRLESDVAALSLQSVDTSGSETLTTGQALLDQLRSTEAVGRLVIDLDQLSRRTTSANLVDDVSLRDGDRLLVPFDSQVVTVIGEVQQNTSHLHQEGLTLDDYLDMSGGVTRRSDEKHTYVVRASGAVLTGDRSRWFGKRRAIEIRAGDTIVVPMDTDRIRPLTFWTNVTQILYQGAIAVAAVKTFSK